jgi:Putative stress-induced transcription regulator/CGNR zinc finger
MKPEMALPPPAPGEDRSVALALVNTEVEARGERIDLLSDAGVLAEWLWSQGLPTEPAAAIEPSDLERVRELRGAVRLINSASALASRVTHLSWEGDTPHSETVWPPDARALEIALASLAEDAISTALGPSGRQLRACEAHGCIRLFIRDHGRRRWCSRACGDRVRVARHYRKVRRRA